MPRLYATAIRSRRRSSSRKRTHSPGVLSPFVGGGAILGHSGPDGVPVWRARGRRGEKPVKSYDIAYVVGLLNRFQQVKHLSTIHIRHLVIKNSGTAFLTSFRFVTCYLCFFICGICSEVSPFVWRVMLDFSRRACVGVTTCVADREVCSRPPPTCGHVCPRNRESLTARPSNSGSADFSSQSTETERCNRIVVVCFFLARTTENELLRLIRRGFLSFLITHYTCLGLLSKYEILLT